MHGSPIPSMAIRYLVGGQHGFSHRGTYYQTGTMLRRLKTRIITMHESRPYARTHLRAPPILQSPLLRLNNVDVVVGHDAFFSYQISRLGLNTPTCAGKERIPFALCLELPFGRFLRRVPRISLLMWILVAGEMSRRRCCLAFAGYVSVMRSVLTMTCMYGVVNTFP